MFAVTLKLVLGARSVSTMLGGSMKYVVSCALAMFMLNIGVVSDRVNNVRASKVNSLRTLIGESSGIIMFFMCLLSPSIEKQG